MFSIASQILLNLERRGIIRPARMLPKIIRIETTNCCNLKCRMCFQSTSDKHAAKNGRKGFINKELFEKIVLQLTKYDQIKDALFYFHIGGEPLLHNDIVSLIRFSCLHGLKPILVTNATLLTRELSEQIVTSGLSKIEISFEGFNREIYESFRVGAEYYKVMSNIDNFLCLNEKNGKPVKTELVVVNLPGVDSSLKNNYIKQMADRFDCVNLSGYFDWLGKIESKVVIDKTKPYIGCNVLDSDLNVLWDGTVVPCCMDVYGEMPIGDFKTMTFEEILLSNERNRLRNKLAKKELDGLLCVKCVVPWGERK